MPIDELTLSVIKADCGSIGGHTRPSPRMVEIVENMIAGESWVIDHIVTYTGDDIAIITTHTQG
jgi:fructose 1,6-bisphosphate aldolase/phosphatase